MEHALVPSSFWRCSITVLMPCASGPKICAPPHTRLCQERPQNGGRKSHAAAAPGSGCSPGPAMGTEAAAASLSPCPAPSIFAGCLRNRARLDFRQKSLPVILISFHSIAPAVAPAHLCIII